MDSFAINPRKACEILHTNSSEKIKVIDIKKIVQISTVKRKSLVLKITMKVEMIKDLFQESKSNFKYEHK